VPSSDSAGLALLPPSAQKSATIFVTKSGQMHSSRNGTRQVGFEILTALSTKMAVFWVVAPCSLVEVYQRFRGPCWLHHQGEDYTALQPRRQPSSGQDKFRNKIVCKKLHVTNCIQFLFKFSLLTSLGYAVCMGQVRIMDRGLFDYDAVQYCRWIPTFRRNFRNFQMTTKKTTIHIFTDVKTPSLKMRTTYKILYRKTREEVLLCRPRRIILKWI
jgi:hypothetical protein